MKTVVLVFITRENSRFAATVNCFRPPTTRSVALVRLLTTELASACWVLLLTLAKAVTGSITTRTPNSAAVSCSTLKTTHCCCGSKTVYDPNKYSCYGSGFLKPKQS